MKYVLLERKNGRWRILLQSDEYDKVRDAQRLATNSTYLVDTNLS